MNTRSLAATLFVLLSGALQATPREDLLFNLNAALKARDGVALANCFNFQDADDATRRSIDKIIGKILKWPTVEVFTSERTGKGKARVEKDGRSLTFNGDWKYQVHIFVSKAANKGYVFPAGPTADGRDRILLTVPDR